MLGFRTEYDVKKLIRRVWYQSKNTNTLNQFQRIGRLEHCSLIRLGPLSRNQEWVLGEVGEVQAVIIDGTSAELQVSSLMRLSR